MRRLFLLIGCKKNCRRELRLVADRFADGAGVFVCSKFCLPIKGAFGNASAKDEKVQQRKK